MQSLNELPIGVFDSGVGGLTVLRSLQAALPHEKFLYLGDTARLPYGTKSQETVTRYTQQACDTLIQRGIKCLVVACVTASTLALPSLIHHFAAMPMVGALEPGARTAANSSKTGKIAIIATEATVKSGGYQQLIQQFRPTAQVSAQSCQLFVALAEEGWVDGPITKAIAARYLEPLLKQHGPDTLVLGCTHFPVLLGAIREVVGDKLNIVDSAQTTAHDVKELLSKKQLLNSSQQKTIPHFLVTDSPQRFHDVAKRFLDREINSSQIELVDGNFK